MFLSSVQKAKKHFLPLLPMGSDYISFLLPCNTTIRRNDIFMLGLLLQINVNFLSSLYLLVIVFMSFVVLYPFLIN